MLAEKMRDKPMDQWGYQDWGRRFGPTPNGKGNLGIWPQGHDQWDQHSSNERGNLENWP